LLAEIAAVDRQLTAQGGTVIEAIEDALAAAPSLRVHLFDEAGEFRTHVLCFLNETSTRWLESLDEPVRDGDEITIVQAVSGG
jgi:molybdopterin converting factor small subunit